MAWYIEELHLRSAYGIQTMDDYALKEIRNAQSRNKKITG